MTVSFVNALDVLDAADRNPPLRHSIERALQSTVGKTNDRTLRQQIISVSEAIFRSRRTP